MAAGETVIVVRRNNHDEELRTAVKRMPANSKGMLCVDEDWMGPDISSSRIRSAIKSGDWAGADSMLPPGVAGHVREYYGRVGGP